METYYIVDKGLVYPTCYVTEDVVPPEGENWKIGELDGAPFETHGIPRYKEVNGVITERTAEEIQDDVDALPVEPPTEADQLRADVDYLTMENEALEEQAELDRADIDYLLMITEEM